MPPKRPQLTLEEPAPSAEAERMKITDTMTLVVADSQGRELRVKETGLGRKDEQPHHREPALTSVLDKISFDDLRIGEIVGAGSQGRVRRVQHKVTGEILALKTLAFSSDTEATRLAIHHELVRVEALKHPNVVSSHEAYFREGKLYILMEYMDAGTMMHVLKRRENKGFAEPRVALIATHLLLGLQHLHDNNVCHRDIKPANLLANSQGVCKISDFGVASSDSAKMHNTSVGSTPYMSPERIKSQPYTTLSDIWSAGLTLAEIVIGQYPLGNVKGKIFELCQLIASGDVTPKWELAAPRTFSPELKDFIMQCLAPVEARPSASDLLHHPFLKQAAGLDLAEMGRWYMNPTDD